MTTWKVSEKTHSSQLTFVIIHKIQRAQGIPISKLPSNEAVVHICMKLIGRNLSLYK